MLCVTTRHSEDFDIFCRHNDPNRSNYAGDIRDYASRVKAFYDQLGVGSAIWTWPEDQPPIFSEPIKPIEYLLEVEESRIVAYIDEWTWSPYLLGKSQTVRYSRTPVRYRITSILVATPIHRDEVKEVRRYRASKTAHCELVESLSWPDWKNRRTQAK